MAPCAITLAEFLEQTAYVDMSPKRRRKCKGKLAGDAKRNSTVSIYFATQSGTAKRFAHDLAIDLSERGYPTQVTDLQLFHPKSFKAHRCIILLLSTYGDGEPPVNCEDFGQWLDDTSMSRNALGAAHFSVFGFGSRDYAHFNAFARHCDAAMEWFGAHRMCLRGEADAAAGNNMSAFQTWKKEFMLPALESTLGIKSKLSKADLGSIGIGFNVNSGELNCTARGDRDIANESDLSGTLTASAVVQASREWFSSAIEITVSKIQELRQSPDRLAGQSTMHVEFTVDPLVLDWQTAGTVEIMPKNSLDDVAWLAKRISSDKDMDRIVIDQDASTRAFTLRDVYTYCDISGQLSMAQVAACAGLARTSDECTALEQLRNDTETFQWLATDVCLTLREFLTLFLPTTQLTVADFLTIVSPQKPRAYTIASSRLEDSATMAVCVSMRWRELASVQSVVASLAQKNIHAPGTESFKTMCQPEGRRYLRGLCSSYMCGRMMVGGCVSVRVRPSNFSSITASTSPIIMVAGGAGVAPFRAYMREIGVAGITHLQKSVLFFGCQAKHVDFLYREEFMDAAEGDSIILERLVVACSRDQEQEYVQQKVQASATYIQTLLDEGAGVYVCGSSSMGRAVREVFTNLLEPKDVQSLVQRGRYVEELW